MKDSKPQVTGGSGHGGSGSDRMPVHSVLEELLGNVGPLPAQPPAFRGFDVIEELGRGSFGTVYRARDEKLGREVAIKVISDERSPPSPTSLQAKAQDLFLAEARALAAVRHPNVLTVHSVLDDGGRMALVTELIEGQPLSELLESNGPLSAAEAAQAGVEVCRALAAVHGAGIVHRDVKTANVLREKGGRIVLCDFGLGSFLAEGNDVESMGAVVGSPLFIAPETIRGEKPDARVDLYALGMMLYNLSTGKFPVTARSLHELFEKIKAGALIPIRDARPDIPEAFAAAVKKALAADPAERFQTAGEMEEALLECAARKARRSIPPWILAFALLAVATVAWWVPRNGGKPFNVRALALRDGKPLSDGDRISVGDGISLELECDQPCYLYVLDEDDAGAINVLFPRNDVAIRNPLPAAQTLHIPGGEGWEVTSVGGQERILLIGSLEPVGDLEDAIAHDRVTREVALRGITRLKKSAQKTAAEPPGPLSSLLDELKRAQRDPDRVNGPWLRKITLRNP